MLTGDEDIHDINLKPTPRSGWWLMVLISWDAFKAAVGLLSH